MRDRYILFVVEEALDVKGCGERHKDLLVVVSFLDSLDGPFTLLVLIQRKPELIEGLSESCDLIFEPLLKLVELLRAELFQVKFLGHKSIKNIQK